MITKMTLEEIYLDWVNNFLTTQRFAEYYGLKIEDAYVLLEICGKFYKK